MTKLPLAIRKSWGFFAPQIGTVFPLSRPSAIATKKMIPLKQDHLLGRCMLEWQLGWCPLTARPGGGEVLPIISCHVTGRLSLKEVLTFLGFKCIKEKRFSELKRMKGKENLSLKCLKRSLIKILQRLKGWTSGWRMKLPLCNEWAAFNPL